MEKLRDAVLSKVRAEAESIIKEAEARAREEVERARRQREARFEEEKGRMLEAAKEEAARILAQASIKARQRVSGAKAEAIARIIDSAREQLSRISSDTADISKLVKEAIEGLGVDRARIYVAPKNVRTIKECLEASDSLSGRIVEVREINCLGGVIAEDIEGKLRIDNTYETRLEMLLPKVLPEISKELFGDL